jgi:transcriptional regulator with XRE-family HTH domain
MFSGMSVSSASACPENDWTTMAPSASAFHVDAEQLEEAEAVGASRMVGLVLRRLALGKTDLARALGVTRQTIYDWLKDAHTPDDARMSKLSALYGAATELEQPLSRALVRSASVGGVTLLQALSEDELDMVVVREVLRGLSEKAAGKLARSPDRSRKEREEHLHSALNDVYGS